MSTIPFTTEMLCIGGQWLRVGRQPGSPGQPPLMLFNGIGGNLELLAPLASWLPEREVLVFDVPGVGHSPLPALPYRPRWIARLAAGVLDHYGHGQADALGVSWGGGAAQQFARDHAARCRRLVLCATSSGAVMVPGHPRVLLKMASPRRYISRGYGRRISGDIYGGDFRRNPALAEGFFRHVRWQSRMGYYFQLLAMAGWTSVHWLRRLRQPTLVMAGQDDPLVPVANARLLHRLIPNSRLELFDCGHLFLLTRQAQSARAIGEFLDKP